MEKHGTNKGTKQKVPGTHNSRNAYLWITRQKIQTIPQKQKIIKNYYEQLYNNGLGNPEETDS